MNKMKVFVTGASGFIGSNLVDFLLSKGYTVIGFDNLSTGKLSFLENAFLNKNFSFIHGDLFDFDKLQFSLIGCLRVYHLAANADVRYGIDHPTRDHQQNTLCTLNVLEAMRKNSIQQIVFASKFYFL
jgi:UDP-glucose 4-epimerase